MNIITKIGLKGVGPFLKGTVFDVPSGITYLYGKNLLAGGNPNASGKSTFASSIAEIFYDEPIVGTRQDKSKGGSRFIEFKRGKKLVRVASSFKGKQNVLSVKVDGEDKSGRTKSNTKEVVDKAWPISQTDFTTYVYLDSVVPHPLARGSTAERKAFFNTFFGLDKLDAEKKLLQAELLKLRKSKAAMVELQETYDSLKEDLLSKQDLEELQEKEQTVRKKVQRLQKAAEQYQEIAQVIEFKRIAQDYITKLKCQPDEISEQLKRCKKIVRAAEAYQEESEDYRSYVKAMEKYRDEVRDLDMDVSLEDLKIAHKEALLLESTLEDLQSEAPKKVLKPEEVSYDRKHLNAEQVQLEHQIDHASRFKEGKCPTCGQAVKKAESVSVLRSKLGKVESRIEELDEYEAKLKQYERYKEKQAEWEKDQRELEQTKVRLKKLKPKSDLYQTRVKIQKPQKVEKPVAVEGAQEAKAYYEVLKFLEPHVDTLKKLGSVDMNKSVTFDPKELNAAQESLSKVRTTLEVHKSVASRASAMRVRLKELKATLEDEEALKLLLEGYSDKAVKKMVIDAISSHLMNTINQCSGMVFSKYKFEFVWGPQVQILVHRPKLGTTDVRKLSGAESKLFTLLLVLALMKFVPKRKRLNLLILDEPTASFSEETTEIFHRLLPQINQIIPSILVVTPRANERYEGAMEYTVVRDKGGSYIQKGHPDEI